MLTDTVLRTIARFEMFEPNARVLVALSGGPDSVALAHLLASLREELRIDVFTAHLNHQLREEAGDDEEFCRTLARQLDIPFTSSSVDVGARASQFGRSLEDEARRARYEFLAAEAEHRSCRHIATGHSLDDQAETVVMRLARGSGPRGLSGIFPVVALSRNRTLIRPLIRSRRAAIESYLDDEGVPFRVDGSNADVRFTRNRVRHRVLPHLTNELNPRLPEALAATASVLRDEDAFMDDIVRETFEELAVASERGVTLAIAKTTHPAIARRLIRLAVEKTKGDTTELGLGHVESVLGLMEPGRSGRTLHLPGVRVEREFDALVFRAGAAEKDENRYNRFEYRVAIPSRFQVWECEGWLSANSGMSGVPVTEWGKASGNTVVVAVEESLTELKLRSPSPTDRFRPLGAPGGKRLSRYLMEQRIARSMRQNAPVVARMDSDEILWVVGHSVAEAARARSGRRAIRLEWTRQ